MKITIAIVFILAAGLVCGAQTPAREASAFAPTPTGTGALSGIIKDEQGQPLRRTVVTITGDMRVTLSTITGDEGKFAFSNLPPGRFTLSAKKPGYPSISYGASRPNRTGSGVLLADGQQVAGLSLTLARGGVLAGTVFDDQGQPMPGVPVMPWEVRTSLAGGRTLDFPSTGGESVTTDDRGMYRLYGLPPGEYTVGTAWFYHGLPDDVRVPTDTEVRRAFAAVTQPPSAPEASSSGERKTTPAARNFTSVFYPDSVDPLAADTIRLAAGDERLGIDLHMQFRPMARIEGVVLGQDGTPRNTEMILARRSPVTALNSTTFWGGRDDGRFVSASLPPGDYTIRARVQPAAGTPAMFAMADVTISGPDPVPVTLRLEPAMTVTGRIVFDGTTTPLPDVSRVRLSFLPTPSGSPADSGATVIDPAGTFTITGVTPGSFRLTATLPPVAAGAPAAWVLQSVASTTRDFTDLPIPVAPGEAPSLTVTLTDQVSELSGTLTDAAGQPATDYFVIVIPADRRYWIGSTRRIVNARPDTHGRFVFRGLPPGDYRIAATTDLVPSDLADANALAQLVTQSAAITLSAGEKKTFDIKIGGR